jgi:hypothetical protein
MRFTDDVDCLILLQSLPVECMRCSPLMQVAGLVVVALFVGGMASADPPRPSAPMNIAPQALEARRTAGEKIIGPDEKTAQQMVSDRRPYAAAAYKLHR